jgi:hypothetical protein
VLRVDYTCAGVIAQESELGAAKVGSFEQTLFSFSITISVIIWIFGGQN